MMKYKGTIFTTIISLIVIGAVIMLPGCAGKDPSVIAVEVSREWAANNVDSVSKSIASLIAKDSPIFKTIVAKTIEKDINDRLAWKFSEPRKVTEDLYEVVATAYTEIDLSILGTYLASIDYNLTIDTKNKVVITADIDPSSFSLTRQ
jgi:hypothetical protein